MFLWQIDYLELVQAQRTDFAIGFKIWPVFASQLSTTSGQAARQQPFFQHAHSMRAQELAAPGRLSLKPAARLRQASLFP